MVSKRAHIVLTVLMAMAVAAPQAAAQELARTEDSYQALIRKNLELRRELQTLEERYQSLENERKVLILHVKELQDAKQASEAKIQELKSTAAALRVEMEKDPELTKKMDSLNRRIETAVDERNRLQEKVAQLEVERAAFDSRRAADLEEIQQARAKNAELAAEVERLRSGYTKDELDLKKTAEGLKAEKLSLEQDKAALQRDLQAARQSLDNEQKELKAELDKIRREKNGLEEKLQGMLAGQESARAALSGTEEKLKKEIQAKDEEIARLKESLRALDQDNTVAGRQAQDLEKEVSRRTKDYGEQLEKSQRDKAALEDKIQALTRDWEERRAAAAAGEEALKARVQDKDREIDQLKQAAAAVESKIAALEKDARGARDSSERLTKELEGQRETLRQQEQAMGDKTRGLEDKNKELRKALEDERAVLAREEAQWQARIKDAQMENVRLEKALMQADVTNESLNKKLARIEQELAENEEVNRRLMKDLKAEQLALETSKKELELESQKRTIEKETFDARFRTLMKDKALLEVQIAQMEERILTAETRSDKALKQAEERSIRVNLRESEIASLREEKSQLEGKLLRYVERMIAQADQARTARAFGRSADPDAGGEASDGGEWSLPEDVPQRTRARTEKLKTRREIQDKKLSMHYNLALAYDRMGMFREEEREYHKCLRINPKDANVHYNLAILYDDKLDRNAKAIHHYRKYLELKPQGEEAIQVKDWILYAEEEDRLKSTIK